MNDVEQTDIHASATPAYLAALAPLGPDELSAVAAIIKASPEFGATTLFQTIELKEPTPAEYRAAIAGAPLPRHARAQVCKRDEPGVWSLTLSLDEERILTTQHFPTKRPMVQVEQLLDVERVVKADPRFIEACARRGITDMTGVCVDAWTGGNFGFPDEEGRLISHTFSWLRLHEFENFYAHPIEGLNVVVDIKTGEVLRLDDRAGPPIPMIDIPYDAKFVTPRAALKPLNIVQPEGVSFVLDGHALRWDKWSFAIGFNPRDGIILHDIRWDDRPIVRRAALAELVVPYGSPEGGHYRQNIFDIGEYGFGKFTNSLKLGCDCLGAIQYLDAHVNMLDGSIYTIEKAICIHEEDAGILWKHWDFRADRTQIRRGRKLVVSCVCTVGNYEYAQYWSFTQSGDIEFELKATGIVNTNACEPGKPSKYATELSPGLQAPIHQHLFCARLDMAVDGSANSIVETNTHAEPTGPMNRHGNAFYAEEKVLTTELAAARRADASTHRSWKVINPGKLNNVGKPVAYKLDTPNCVTPFLHEDGPSGLRSSFTRNHVWVTPFHEDERYPAGEFVCNSDGSDSLAEIVKQDRSVENTDIVLWHVFGLHHIVRPEDFPVQPCISCGFSLMPSGFFSANPGIDVPETTNGASVLAGGGDCCH
jgi:primary-amine oxidase